MLWKNQISALFLLVEKLVSGRKLLLSTYECADFNTSRKLNSKKATPSGWLPEKGTQLFLLNPHSQGWCVWYRLTTWSHTHSTNVHPPLCSQDKEENRNLICPTALALSSVFTSSTSSSSHFMMELVPGSGCCLHVWIDLSLQYWATLTIPLELNTFCLAFLQGALETVLSSASASFMSWSNQLKFKTAHSQKNLTVWILAVSGYLDKDMH